MTTSLFSEIKWLIKHFAPFLRLHVSCLLCALAFSVLTMLDPLIIRWLIDDVIAHGKSQLLLLVTAAFLVNYGARIFFDRLGMLFSSRIVEKMLYHTRVAMLRRLQRLSVQYHESQQVGDMLYRFQTDIEQIAQVGGSVVPAILRVLIVTLLTLVAMCLLNIALTLVVLLVIPCFIFVHHSFQGRLRSSSELAREKAGKLSAFLQDHLSAIVQVKLLSREVTEARRFAGLAADNARAQISRHKTELIFLSLSPLLVITGIAIMLGYGGHLVISGTLSVGGLVAFYGYSLQLFGPLYSLVDTYSRFQRLGASVSRIIEIETAPVTIAEQPGALSLSRETPGSLELRDVYFGYRPDTLVLKGTSFLLTPGEKAALVGVSGSGKSTIAHLITRLADVQDGAILIDSRDVKSMKLASLRSTVCLVPQDPVLFNATLRENLMMGDPRASSVALEEAVELAQLSSLIRRLPRGWDEPVGPRGSKLSGGERHRLALARAILQRPRILILDELTSSLDYLTESAILKSLDGFVEGRTVLVISHRLSTIRWADRVLVLDAGQIAEDGNPNDLRNEGTFFDSLFKKQVITEHQILDQFNIQYAR